MVASDAVAHVGLHMHPGKHVVVAVDVAVHHFDCSLVAVEPCSSYRIIVEFEQEAYEEILFAAVALVAAPMNYGHQNVEDIGREVETVTIVVSANHLPHQNSANQLPAWLDTAD